MFGGLHLEMGVWTMLRDYLTCSGWTAAFTEAGIVTAGKADSFLKMSHLTMQNTSCAPTYLHGP